MNLFLWVLYTELITPVLKICKVFFPSQNHTSIGTITTILFYISTSLFDHILRTKQNELTKKITMYNLKNALILNKQKIIKQQILNIQ